jgi:hypothetical protein
VSKAKEGQEIPEVQATIPEAIPPIDIEDLMGHLDLLADKVEGLEAEKEALLGKLEALPPTSTDGGYGVTTEDGVLYTGGCVTDREFVYHREVSFSGDSGYSENIADRAKMAAASAFGDPLRGIRADFSNLPDFSGENRLVVIVKVVRPEATE